jgi:SAM-dependent methyltransferase
MSSPADFWNERYRDDAYAYGVEPNEWLSAGLEGLEPGRILLPADGEGRNSVFAASLGWEVAAFDISDAGREKALALASTRGLEINYRIGNALEIDYPARSFDCIAFVFTHFPVEERTEIFARLLKTLKPGGTVLFECYDVRQLHYREKYGSGGPATEMMLFRQEELPRLFSSCETVFMERVETMLDEGTFHQGMASVLRYRGIKQDC